MVGSEDQRRADVDGNVAYNVRHFREQAGLSQEELAQRMSEHGFGFTQATIWKVEQGQRPIKISEAVALGAALELRTWTYLTAPPEVSDPLIALQTATRRAHQVYGQLRAAAREYLQTQEEVVVTVRAARDAGLPTDIGDAWLNEPPERAVVEARVDWDQQDHLLDQREEQVDALMRALRDAGYEPPRPENVEIIGGTD